jgi:hypothetical protein
VSASRRWCSHDRPTGTPGPRPRRPGRLPHRAGPGWLPVDVPRRRPQCRAVHQSRGSRRLRRGGPNRLTHRILLLRGTDPASSCHRPTSPLPPHLDHADTAPDRDPPGIRVDGPPGQCQCLAGPHLGAGQQSSRFPAPESWLSAHPGIRASSSAVQACISGGLACYLRGVGRSRGWPQAGRARPGPRVPGWPIGSRGTTPAPGSRRSSSIPGAGGWGHLGLGL